MRICIPTQGDEGRAAKVYGHFGSAPYFTIYDSEKDVFEVINNHNQHHLHGTCHPLGMLEAKKIDAVVCAGMGARAVQSLNEGGIRAFKIAAGVVEEAIRKYKEGLLEEISFENACTQHKCH